MDTKLIDDRVNIVVEEQFGEFDALISAVQHVATSNPPAAQRVILCNNLVVGLTARIEESLRQIFVENLRIIEECEFTFFDLKAELQKASFGSSILELKKSIDWETGRKRSKQLFDLLSGFSSFKLPVASIVNNQGNMRTAEVTEIAKRFGINGLWRAVASDGKFAAEWGEDSIQRLEGKIVQKWNAVFDERDNVVHRVSQANGWSTDVIIEHIEFAKHVVGTIGAVVAADCITWFEELASRK